MENCKHIYKKFVKTYPMYFRFINRLTKVQSDHTYNQIGLEFLRCRFCQKVKSKKIYASNNNEKFIKPLWVVYLFYNKLFINDNIKEIKNTKDILVDIIEKIKKSYGWK